MFFQDLIPIPINREPCAIRSGSDDMPIVEKEFLEVTWKLTYAGRTVPKLLLGNTLSSSVMQHRMKMTGTDYEKALYQNGVQFRRK